MALLRPLSPPPPSSLFLSLSLSLSGVSDCLSLCHIKALMIEYGAARVEIMRLEDQVKMYKAEIKEMRSAVVQLQIKLQIWERSDVEQQHADCRRALWDAARPVPLDPALAAAPIDFSRRRILSQIQCGASALVRSSESGLQGLGGGKQEEEEDRKEALRKARVEINGLEDQVKTYQADIKEMRLAVMHLQIKLQSSTQERGDIEQQLADCKRALAGPAGGFVALTDRLEKNMRFLERVVARCTRRDVSAALNGWKASVGNHRRVSMLGVRIVGHRTHLQLSQAYETWHDHALALALSRDTLRRIAVRWRLREVSVAFFSWRSKACKQLRARRVCTRVVQHWLHLSSATAFECWYAHALEQKRMEQVCKYIMQKMINHSLDVAIMTWKDHTRKQRRMKDVCFRIMLRLVHRNLSMAFEWWHRLAKEQRLIEIACSRMVRHMLNLQVWSLCRLCFVLSVCIAAFWCGLLSWCVDLTCLFEGAEAGSGIRGMGDLEGPCDRPRQKDGSLRVHRLQGRITLVLSHVCRCSPSPSVALCLRHEILSLFVPDPNHSCPSCNSSLLSCLSLLSRLCELARPRKVKGAATDQACV